jgi:hypothetical protein
MAGFIFGTPELTMGHGHSSFEAAGDGEEWQTGSGAQGGGGHVWLGIRTQGLGPALRLRYEYLELDGALLERTSGTTSLCWSPHGQQDDSVTAFLPSGMCAQERVWCGGPFLFRVTATDAEGRSDSDERTVDHLVQSPNSFGGAELCGDPEVVGTCHASHNHADAGTGDASDGGLGDGGT